MATRQSRPQEPRRRPILVLAADPAERDWLRVALEAKGWPVVTAADAQSTAEAIRQQPPGLVILRHTRGHDAWSIGVEAACPPGVAILVLAGADGQHSPTSYLPEALTHLAEPFDLDHLDEQIRALLAAPPDSEIIRFWRRNFLRAGDEPGLALPRDPIAGGAESDFPPAWAGLVRTVARARHQHDLARWLLAMSRANRLEAERQRAALAETRAWARAQARPGWYRRIGAVAG